MDCKIVSIGNRYKYIAGDFVSQTYTRRRTAIRGARRRLAGITIISPIPTGKRGQDKSLRNRKYWMLAGKRGLEYYRIYNSLPHRRQKQIEHIYRFINNHPFINNTLLLFCENMIRKNERNVSLDTMIRGYDKNLYDFIDAKELNKHKDLANAI